MGDKSHSMATKAVHQAVEPASLCVIMAQSTVSAHSAADGSPRCGMRAGAMRISAPLPADFGPLSYHGFPDLKFAKNSRTVAPMPKIRPPANRRAAQTKEVV